MWSPWGHSFHLGANLQSTIQQGVVPTQPVQPAHDADSGDGGHEVQPAHGADGRDGGVDSSFFESRPRDVTDAMPRAQDATTINHPWLLEIAIVLPQNWLRYVRSTVVP